MRNVWKWMLLIMICAIRFSMAAEAPTNGNTTVTGVVTVDGRLKEGLRMRIALFNPDSTEVYIVPSFETVTDSNGVYKLENLQAAPVMEVSVGEEIRVGGEEHTVTRFAKRVKMEAGKVNTVNLGDDLGTITLHGRIMVNQKPAAFERIYITTVNEESWDYTEFETFTDGTGRFSQAGLIAEKYRIYFNHEKAGHLDKEIQVSNDKEQTLEFNYNSVAMPFVIPEFLKALPEGEIKEIKLNKGIKNSDDYFSYLADPANEGVRTSAEGMIDGQTVEFSGNLAGDYEVRVSFATASNCSYELKLPERRTISTAHSQPDQGLIQLPEYTIGSLSLNVTDSSGTPATNIPVTLHLPKDGALSSKVSTRTNEQGMAEFPALVEGAYSVELPSPAGASSTFHPVEVKGAVSKQLQAAP